MVANKRKIHREIEGKRTILRSPMLENADEFLACVSVSRDLHYELVYPPNELPAYLDYVRKNKQESNECFLVFEKTGQELCGAANLTQIVLGGFCSAYLGYYLFEPFTGRGLMTDAVITTLAFAFDEIGLHRVEANIQPHNHASRELARRCGFVMEGYSRNYLKVGGEWRDHERWAILKEDFMANPDKNYE